MLVHVGQSQLLVMPTTILCLDWQSRRWFPCRSLQCPLLCFLVKMRNRSLMCFLLKMRNPQQRQRQRLHLWVLWHLAGAVTLTVPNDNQALVKPDPCRVSVVSFSSSTTPLTPEAVKAVKATAAKAALKHAPYNTSSVEMGTRSVSPCIVVRLPKRY